MTIAERLAEFRGDLPHLSVRDVVQRHVTTGECFALTTNQYFDLRKRVGKHFGVHVSSVIVVGSAKLGFSIAPTKRYQEFSDASDIDVAVCEGSLFDTIWLDVFEYWRRGGQWPDLGAFRKYLFRGWMRPDMLPPERSFVRSQEWWDFFRALTASGQFGRFKITGALYKSWGFLEAYQERCVAACQQLESGHP